MDEQILLQLSRDIPAFAAVVGFWFLFVKPSLDKIEGAIRELRNEVRDRWGPPPGPPNPPYPGPNADRPRRQSIAPDPQGQGA